VYGIGMLFSAQFIIGLSPDGSQDATIMSYPALKKY
jgi:hypothetical protein